MVNATQQFVNKALRGSILHKRANKLKQYSHAEMLLPAPAMTENSTTINNNHNVVNNLNEPASSTTVENLLANSEAV